MNKMLKLMKLLVFGIFVFAESSYAKDHISDRYLDHKKIVPAAVTLLNPKTLSKDQPLCPDLDQPYLAHLERNQTWIDDINEYLDDAKDRREDYLITIKGNDGRTLTARVKVYLDHLTGIHSNLLTGSTWYEDKGLVPAMQLLNVNCLGADGAKINVYEEMPIGEEKQF